MNPLYIAAAAHDRQRSFTKQAQHGRRVKQAAHRHLPSRRLTSVKPAAAREPAYA